MERVGEIVELKTEYVADVDGTMVHCKRTGDRAPGRAGATATTAHTRPLSSTCVVGIAPLARPFADGPSECEGNRYQLCARMLDPDPAVWFNFVVCQGERGRRQKGDSRVGPV